MKRPPNKSWLIQFIAELNPTHAIFKKNYIPPKKDLKEMKVVGLPPEFLQGLPESSSKAKKNRLAVFGVAKDKIRVRKLEEKQELIR